MLNPSVIEWKSKFYAVNFLAQILCPTWKLYRYFIINNSYLSVEGPPGHRPKDNDHKVNFQECNLYNQFLI